MLWNMYVKALLFNFYIMLGIIHIHHAVLADKKSIPLDFLAFS